MRKRTCLPGMKVIALIFLSTLLFSFINVYAKDTSDFDLDATALDSALKKVEWHGYYEFEYWSKEAGADTFDAHKITLWMGLPINKKVFLSSEFEYEHFPRLDNSGNQANGGSGELKLDSAQLRITPVRNIAAYMGVFYVPFGIEYYSYPGHKNKLITRPKVMKGGGVIPGTWSDVGIGLNYSLENVGQVDTFVINGDAKNGGISRDTSTGGNKNKSFGFRLQLDKMIEGFNFGGSWVTGKWDEDDLNVSYRFGPHIKIESAKMTGVKQAPLIIAEYVLGTDENASSIAGKDKKVNGFYILGSSSINEVVEFSVRYGQYDNDTAKADNIKNETSFGLGFHVLDNFQIKGEYRFEESSYFKHTGIVQVVAFW